MISHLMAAAAYEADTKTETDYSVGPACLGVQWPSLSCSAVVSLVLKVQWPVLLCSEANSPVV